MFLIALFDKFLDSYCFVFFYYSIYATMAALLVSLSYIQYHLYKYIGYMSIVDMIPFICLLSAIYVAYNIEPSDYLVMFTMALLIFTNVYYLSALHIVVFFSGYFIMEGNGLLYMGHSQSWYWTSILFFNSFSAFDVRVSMIPYFWEDSIVSGHYIFFALMLIYYFVCCFIVSKLSRDSQHYFFFLHVLALGSYIFFCCFYPEIPY